MKKKVLIIGGSGLVGSAIKKELDSTYITFITSRHRLQTANAYQLDISDSDRLLSILNSNNPDIVISSLRGDFDTQMKFHKILADWIKDNYKTGENKKKLLFISTANVFDGDLSRPWTEKDVPAPESDYGIFKRDCEEMLRKKLQDDLIIFRLPSVWGKECPRIKRLRDFSASSEPMITYPNDKVNISLADQVGKYALYVLEHNLSGIFHVGTTDTVDYFEFEKTVCKALDIKEPNFKAGAVIKDAVYQAVLPAREEIPETLQMTVQDVLEEIISLYETSVK